MYEEGSSQGLALHSKKLYFWGNCSFICSCKKQYRETLHVLHPVSANGNILHDCSSASQRAYWHQPPSDFTSFHAFLLCVCVSFVICNLFTCVGPLTTAATQAQNSVIAMVPCNTLLQPYPLPLFPCFTPHPLQLLVSSLSLYIFLILTQGYVYWFEREEGAERETSISSLPYSPQPGTKPPTPVCALTGNWTCNLLVHKVMLQPTEPPNQSYFYNF